MGQNQGGQVNPLLQDWQQHPVQSNIFINNQTGQQAECHVLVLRKAQQTIIKKRMQQNHNFIGRILYYQPVQKNKIIKDEGKYYVYTEKLYRLSYDLWVPITSALSILKGFRRLSSTYGYMNVTPNMIKVNQKKQIRVWINQSIIRNQPYHKIDNQQEMVSDIAKIITDFDYNLGCSLINCLTINDAINNILHSITQTSIQFNSKISNKNQQKFSFGVGQKSMIGNKNNIFRSTKQTEGDQLKPLNDSGDYRQNLKKDSLTSGQIKSPKNYLQNVNIPPQPFYIDTRNNDTRGIQPLGPRKLTTQPNSTTHEKNALSFSQQANTPKQHPNLNITQPQKFVPPTRTYKPIEPKNFNINTISNFNTSGLSAMSSNKTQKSQSRQQATITGNLTPTYSNTPNTYSTYQPNYQQINQPNYPNLSQTSKQANKFKQMLHKPSSNPNGYGQRKYNTNNGLGYKNNQKIEASYDSQSRSRYYGANDKSQINTSRDIMQSQSYSNIRYPMPQTTSGITNPQHADPHRTKTQQFYNLNANHAPRFKTNYLQTNTHNELQKPVIAQSTIQIQKRPQRIYTHTHSSTTPNKLPSNVPSNINIANNINSVNNLNNVNIPNSINNINPNLTQSNKSQQNKKLLKIKQAQKIKQQMSILGLQNSASKPKELGNDKSARDLLIKKKVEQKNKKHQDLKNAISKLLKQ